MKDEAMKFYTIQGIKRTSTMSQAAYDNEMTQLAQRQARGRYTLEEAAMAVNKATGARAEEMLHKFMKAAEAGALATYEPGKDSRYIYGEGFASRVRDFYEEAYWDDLNVWLGANERRIKFEFPVPPVEPDASELKHAFGASDVDTSKAITRRKRSALIKEVQSDWPTIENDLRHSDENGLNAAKLPEHGYWNISVALNWANENGKLRAAKVTNKPPDVSAWGLSIANVKK